MTVDDLISILQFRLPGYDSTVYVNEINRAYREVWRSIVAVDASFWRSTSSPTVSTAATDFDLTSSSHTNLSATVSAGLEKVLRVRILLSGGTAWIPARPLHENHPYWLDQATVSPTPTNSTGPYFYVVFDSFVSSAHVVTLRFPSKIPVSATLEIEYTYNPANLAAGSGEIDLPTGYQEVVADVATRNMYSSPGDDARFAEWSGIADKHLQELLAAIRNRQTNQSQRQSRRRRWIIDSAGRAVLLIDDISHDSQPALIKEGGRAT